MSVSLNSFLLFPFGLIVGSFLGALSFRLPLRIGITRGRSVCPKCGNQIAWYDNIPILSFFLLGGKCKKCKKKISIRYPLIELTTALAFVFLSTFSYLGIFNFLFLFVIWCLLFVISIIDLEHQIIPDELVFVGIVFALLLAETEPDMFFGKLFAGFAGALFLLLLHFVTRGHGMGLGDVKLAILLGLLLGPMGTLYGFFAAFLTGAVVGIILILAGRAGFKQKIAFGPFMIIGFVLAYLFK